MEIVIHLVAGLIKGLEKFESWLRPPLRLTTPIYDDLVADPARTFAVNGPVTIGPARRRIVSGLCGAVAAYSGLLMANAFRHVADPNRAWLIGPEWQAVVAVWCLLHSVGGYRVAAPAFRGGVTVLSDDGVGFAYRNRVVFCPWSAFPPETVGRRVDAGAIDLDLVPDAVQRVRLSVGGEDVEVPKFDAKPFRIHTGTASNGAPVWLGRLYDYHRCRADELAWLITAVSLKMNGHVPTGTVAE